MDKILEQILTKLEKLDKIEMDVAVVKSDIKKLDKKIDGITDVVAKTMEDITEIKGRIEEQDIEIRVIKGEAANA